MDKSGIEWAARRYDQMRGRFQRRDDNMHLVKMVREGRMHEVTGMGQYFSDEIPRSVSANLVRVAAEDLRNVMGTLPALDCSSGNGIAATDKKRAITKNRIGRNIWDESRLETEFVNFADYYNSYGVAILHTQPDFKRKMPIITVEDPRGFYYLKDRWGRVAECAKTWEMELDAVCHMFPEAAAKLKGNHKNVTSGMVSIVQYTSKESGTYLFCPTNDNLVLQHVPSVIDGELPYHIVELPSLSDIPGGRFDETIWIQYAKVLMTQYTFRAAERSINAPLVLPRDVNNVEMGIDSHIYTDNWKPGMGVMGLTVPREVFAYNETLEAEAKESAGYPDARNGRVNASIVTGRGVEALMGTFDTQIKTAQMLFKRALEDATEYAFKVYLKLFPNASKTICGVENGQSYRVVIKPSRDIGEDYEVNCTYGFMLGNSPAQAVMMLLQFQNGDLLSRESVQKKLPWDIDYDMENRQIHIQRLDDSILQGVAAYSQSLGILLQQGLPANQVFDPIVKLIKARQNGKALAEAALEAFTPPEPEPSADPMAGAVPPEGAMPSGPEGPGMAPGGPGGAMLPSGLLRGVAPGQAGMPPGGLPTILNTAASLRGDQARPEMNSTVLRRRAVGG
jgi:hypothetical protein